MKTKLIWCFSVIAVVLSMVAVVVSIFVVRVEPLSVAWTNTLIATLAILTTVLITWQIWSVVSFDRRIENVKDVLRKEIDKKVRDAECEFSALSYVSTARIYVNVQKTDYHNYMWALFHLLVAIEKYSRVSNKDENLITNINIVLEESLKTINATSYTEQDKKKFREGFIDIEPGIERSWLDALHRIWTEEKIDKKSVEILIEFLQKI